MEKIGIIGTGHMGKALLKGLIRSRYAMPRQFILSGGKSGKTQELANKLKCIYASSNTEVAKKCNHIILAVTPQVLPHVLKEIAASISKDTLLISLAASFTIADLEAHLPAKTQIIRALPNIPVDVCAGMTALCASSSIKRSSLNAIRHMFESVGKTLFVEENKLPISSIVAGCSPAFTALFIEALADAGVMYGLSRDEAYLIAKQAALGTAQSLLEQEIHPAEFKDMVASPGGITIRGIAALEQNGLRNAVIQAVKAANTPLT